MLLTHGSYALLLAALVVAGFGVPIPEDPVLLTGGVLAHRGVTNLWLTIAVCAAGVLIGDVTLFSVARRLGPSVLERPHIAKLLTPARRGTIEGYLARYGGAVVFVGRHLPGLRPAVFAMAAVHGMSRARFVLWDALGLCVSAPVVVYLGYAFSDRIDLVRRDMARAEHWLLIAGVVVLAGYACFARWRARGATRATPDA